MNKHRKRKKDRYTQWMNKQRKRKKDFSLPRANATNKRYENILMDEFIILVL